MRTILRTLIFVFLTLFANYLPAQDNSLEQPIGWRGNDVELHSITDKAKQQACTIVEGPDSIRAFVTDKELQIVQQFGLVRLPKEQVLGGFFDGNRVYLFIENDNYHELHRQELDLATGNTTDKWIAFDLEKEQVIDRISGGDRFLCFTADRKTSEFIIYDFSRSDSFATLRYNFDKDIWHDLTDGGLFNRSINVEKIDLEGECNLEAAAEKNKLYLQNDTLFLVMNNHLDSTQVFSFDLQQKKVNFHLIKHGSGSSGNSSVSYNSFLLRNKLYYVRANPDSLLLQVVDLYSGAAVKTFVAGKDDSISFKNTPIMQEGSAYSATTSRELDRTAQLLRKMVNGDAVIIASPHENNQVQLMIGSYTKLKGDIGKSMYVPGHSVGSHFITGGYRWIPASGFKRNTWIKSARFKTLLNGNTYDPADGDTNRSINEQIDKFADEFRKPPQAENLYMVNGRYYYAFYDRTDYRLVILEF